VLISTILDQIYYEVTEAIANLKTGKAEGWDGIFAEMINLWEQVEEMQYLNAAEACINWGNGLMTF